MRNKKGVSQFLNTVSTILMVIIVLIGIFLLNITSDENIQTAKEKAEVGRNKVQAKETLQVLSKLPVQTSQGTFTFAQALDKYYVLEMQDDLSRAQKDLRNELESEIKIAAKNLITTPLYITSRYVYEKTEQESLEIYMNPLTSPSNFDYGGSAILPSSYTRNGNYYINISAYLINDVKYQTNTAVVIAG